MNSLFVILFLSLFLKLSFVKGISNIWVLHWIKYSSFSILMTLIRAASIKIYKQKIRSNFYATSITKPKQVSTNVWICWKNIKCCIWSNIFFFLHLELQLGLFPLKYLNRKQDLAFVQPLLQSLNRRLAFKKACNCKIKNQYLTLPPHLGPIIFYLFCTYISDSLRQTNALARL